MTGYVPASAQSVPEQVLIKRHKSCVHSAKKLGLQRLVRIVIFSNLYRVLSQEGFIWVECIYTFYEVGGASP